MKEESLSGGTVGEVSRVGNTARRRTERWTPAVHDLLRHLEAVHFPASPRVLGIDEKGREILTWIEGSIDDRPWPLTDDMLLELGGFVRSFHDAVSSYHPPPDTEWFIGKRSPREGEIICHGDMGPWNILWLDGHPVGIIDWDFAEPAPPLADLAELAFFVVPMRDDDWCRENGFDAAPDRKSRLKVLSRAYGTDEIERLVDLAEEFLRVEAERTREFGPKGIHPWAGFLTRRLPEGQERMLNWLKVNRDALV